MDEEKYQQHPRSADTPEQEAKVLSPDDNADVSRKAPRSNFRAIMLVMTCTMGMITNIAATVIVAIALHDIGQDLNIPEDRIQWPFAAFALSSGCLLLLAGRLADLYGRKKVFLLGLIWLGAFSIGCGFSQNEITLNVLRALQGAGGAAIIPAAVGILAHSFPPSEARSRAFATFSAGAPVGGAIGICLGGVLTELAPASWRAAFFLIAGLAFFAAICGIVSIDADIPNHDVDKRVDWIGAGLITCGLVLVTFVLSEGEIAPQGWATPYIIALLIIGVLLIPLFLAWEYYLANSTSYPPLMRLQLWTRAKGRFAVIQIVIFLVYSGFMSFIIWAQLYYQTYLEYSPTQTLLRFIPMMISGIICNIIFALLVGRIGGIYLLFIGTLATGVACVLFANIDPQAVYWSYGFVSFVLCVFAADFVFASGMLFVAKVARPEEQSVAGALFQTMSQLGSSVGLAVTTTVHNKVTRQEAERLGYVVDRILPSQVPKGAILAGYRAAQYTGFGFSMLAMIMVILFLRNIGVLGHRAKATDAADEKVDSVS